jgi:hypothetical protein
MPTYKAPVSDTLFLLTDVFDLQRYSNLPRFSEAPIDVVEAVLSEGGRFAEQVLQPLNAIGDREGCKRGEDGAVATPKGFKEAYSPIRPTSRAAGSGSRARRNMAARACRIFSAWRSANTSFPPIRLSRCIPASPTARPPR